MINKLIPKRISSNIAQTRMLIFAGSFFFNLAVNAQFRVLTPPTPLQVVEEMDADSRGNILFATDKGILLLDTNNLWTEYNHSSGVTNLHIKSVKHSQNGFIYSDVNKRFGTCDYFTASDSVFGSGFGYNYISALYLSGTGDTLLAGTDNGKVLWYNGASLNQLSFGTTLGPINDIVLGVNGHFFSFNSSNKGLLYQLPNNPFLTLGTTSSYIPDNDIISSVSSNNIIYYGTGKGLFTVDYTNIPSFTYTISNVSNTPGLPSDSISAVAIANGSVFVGTPKGLAVHTNNTWTFYTTSNSNLPSSYIRQLAVNSKNELFLATKQGTICKFDTTARGYVGIKKDQAHGNNINLFLILIRHC